MTVATAWDVVVIGAGAAGMMCAIEAGRRGRRVLVVDHAATAGEKIRISGGGRCNFTNLNTSPANFISANRHFCRSALSRYTQHDFIDMVRRHGIAFHEKTLGQLFCDGSATQIIRMLLDEMQAHHVALALSTRVERVERSADGFRLALSSGMVDCASLVVACGGRSIPKIGATGLGYDLARQFGLPVTETRPALVPLTFDAELLERLKPLAGVAVDTAVTTGGIRFDEAMLFTHRGLSGPAILQASSYWREGEPVEIAMLPGLDVYAALRAARTSHARQSVQTWLGHHLPRRLAQSIAEDEHTQRFNLADLPDTRLRSIANAVNAWRVVPVGTEGYRTAEVTLGGVDTRALDQKTMAARAVPGLYFIGEVVDVTGWLGGYNFQWAWSSGWVAGQAA
ncbi:NAD(P)/FAD-dependent oxidoreductase (plasmid) [Tistrella bauzanensis]|uniref:NAD(P)/FAD-dependent oxidoreductase n=1 Tax=Tistrella arctica TaxID=3133430 RepID=A0ABU9YNH1_9PROT